MRWSWPTGGSPAASMLLEAGRAEVRDLVEAQDAQISAQNAVIAAITDYQQSRLQLLLDVGALDTTVPQFWLKDTLAVAYRPSTESEQAQPDSQADAVQPPENYFKN